MYKICILGIYFGNLPSYFPLWLESCKYNSTVDFLIINDQNITDLPVNVRQVKMSFNDFRVLVQSKFDFPVSLERPYKICDFRPAFGLICSEYIQGYDFWGHCDFDMIFGDIRKYITDDLLNSYDKILPLGHLSIYRNNEENNSRFKLSGSLVGDYKKVFTTDKSFAFDETRGIYQIYKTNFLPVYDKRIFADISSIYRRFRLALDDVNYEYQIFSFDKGRIFREYILNRKYNKEEFIYLHIKKPKHLEIKTDNYQRYFITNTGFYEKNGDATLDDIEKYNKYRGALFEQSEKIAFIIKNKYQRFIEKLKEFTKVK
ncbi:MAG TPA: hypothetical protein PLI94_10120 [Bacillota bacterium]|nr:hypothetical protein [Bacillota bacterium]